MKRRNGFSWEMLAVSILTFCLLCYGGLSLPLYVFPQVPEPLAEELRQDADRLSQRYKNAPGERASSPEIPEWEWTPAIRSLDPRRVFLLNNELHVDLGSFAGLGRYIVIVPDKIDQSGPGTQKEYHHLSHRVYRIVIWWD